MITTVTPNPAIDVTLEVPALVRGEVHRTTGRHQEPSGKGVNVSRALVASGLETIAVLPGAENDPVLAGLLHDGVPFAALPIDEPLRTNVALTEPGGVTTKINEPGPIMDADQQEALIGLLLERARGASWGQVVLWDAHSIRSVVPRFFDGRLPDLNLADCGRRRRPADRRRLLRRPARRRRLRNLAGRHGTAWDFTGRGVRETGPPQTQRRGTGGTGCSSRLRHGVNRRGT